jgi:hypothetical protein
MFQEEMYSDGNFILPLLESRVGQNANEEKDDKANNIPNPETVI